ALSSFSGTAHVSRDALPRRSRRFRGGDARRLGLSRGKDRFAARLVARFHASAGGDGPADAESDPVTRGGLFAAGLAQAAQGTDRPASLAFRVAAGRVARLGVGAVGAADCLARHEI